MKMTIFSMAMLMITIMMLMMKMTMSIMMMTMMTDPSHVGSFEQLLGSDGNVVEEAEAVRLVWLGVVPRRSDYCHRGLNLSSSN